MCANGLAYLWLTKGVDNHKVCLHATRPLGHDSENETFSWSRPEDADISGKGTDDHIGLCVRLPLDDHKVQITIRCVHVLPDPCVMIAKLRLFHGLGRKMLTSPGRVQMTTLASSYQSNLGSSNDGCR